MYNFVILQNADDILEKQKVIKRGAEIYADNRC